MSTQPRTIRKVLDDREFGILCLLRHDAAGSPECPDDSDGYRAAFDEFFRTATRRDEGSYWGVVEMTEEEFKTIKQRRNSGDKLVWRKEALDGSPNPTEED